MSISPVTFTVEENKNNITRIKMAHKWGNISFRVISYSPKNAEHLITELGRLTIAESLSFVMDMSTRGLPGCSPTPSYGDLLDKVGSIGRHSKSPAAREHFCRQGKARALSLMDEDMGEPYISSDEEEFKRHIHEVSDEENCSDDSSSGVDSIGFSSSQRGRPPLDSYEEKLKLAKERLKFNHKKGLKKYKMQRCTKIDITFAKRILKNNR